MKTAASTRAELPRERVERLGPQALSLVEIIAILLRTGARGKNVLELASSLVKEYGDLQGLSRASFREFMEMGGLGKAKSATLVAAYLMRHEDLPYDDCFILMKDARPLVKLEDRHRRRLEAWNNTTESTKSQS